ncbi:hypothetical protein VTA80_15405 [Pengzhenrongella phosphoraccumulans]
MARYSPFHLNDHFMGPDPPHCDEFASDEWRSLPFHNYPEHPAHITLVADETGQLAVDAVDVVENVPSAADSGIVSNSKSMPESTAVRSMFCIFTPCCESQG